MVVKGNGKLRKTPAGRTSLLEAWRAWLNAWREHRRHDPVWRLWGYARPFRKRILMGVVCGIVMSLIMAGIGGCLALMTKAMEDGNFPRVTLLAALTPVIFVLKGVTYYGQVYLLSTVAERVGQKLRNRLYEHMQTLSLTFFETRRTGGLIATISADVPVVQQQLNMILMEGVTGPFIVIVGVAYMMWMDWRLATATIITLTVMGYAINKAGKRMRSASEGIQKSLSAISGLATETLAAIRVVRSFGAEEREAERFREESERTYGGNMRVVRISALLRPVVELLGALSIAFVLWFGGMEIARGKLDLPGVLSVLYVTQQVTMSLQQVGRFSSYLNRLHGAAKRVFEVLDIEPEVRDAPDAVPLHHVQGHVEFDHVTFGYDAGDPVLRGLSFDVKPGEVVALVGPSGVGKSTIAALIPRFYDVNGGAISVDGLDIRKATAQSLRASIGIVAQEPVLFSGTIRENIAYGRPDASEADVVAAARAANAHNFITQQLPEGYATVVGERGAKLSGGQKQRIAIARALLRDPRILILDEATSALDAESEALVQEALDTLMKGRSTIVIAHRLSTVRKADRILVLSQGGVAEQGPHDELIRLGGLYARLYERGLGEARPAANGTGSPPAAEGPANGWDPAAGGPAPLLELEGGNAA